MIKIPRNIIDEIIKQAYDELPDEACGLLTGLNSVVHTRYAMTNTDHSPEHFSFDPQEQFNVLKEARRNGQKIIANYHSHPESPARPSEEDIRLAYDPEAVYIIVSLASGIPDMKAFSKVNGRMQPCEIKVV
ncbi:MAG: M67 family metallopeptidase [Tannerella sp.]|jgi:proteasome lid subunit RPN8/RPN11|nr:M67 family metallopeptidase [Tannerella sp.]